MKRLMILDAIAARDWNNLTATPVSGAVIKLQVSELDIIADAFAGLVDQARAAVVTQEPGTE